MRHWTGSLILLTFIRTISPLNWNFVRGFGELTILSRASFSMLFIVPILAALWPTIKLALDSYNNYVVLRNNDLKSSFDSLQSVVEEIPIQPTTALPTIPPDLPAVWAVAFLASLCAVFGSVIYQTRAPSLIKDYKLSEFEESRLKRYRENPTEGQISTAIHRIKACKERYWDPNNETRRAYYSELEARRHALEQRETTVIGQSFEEERSALEREYITNAARERHDESAYSMPIYSKLASILYLVSLGCILWIIWTQSTAVFQQAGWIS